MNVWKKKTVRWRLDGRNVPRGTKGAKKRVTQSKRFYGTLKRSDGKTKQVPLTEDVKTSRTLLRRLQSEADHDRTLGVTPKDRERQKPLTELLIEYLKHLCSKENTPLYVKTQDQRIRSLLKTTKTNTIDDLQSSRVANILSQWRKHGRGQKKTSFSIASSNHYARAIKGFTRWLWTEGKIERDPLVSLRLLNAKTDVRRQRRAFTSEELKTLVDVTQKSGKTYRGDSWTFTPTDRAMLYLIAAYTGLRASELASLTVDSFDLEAKTVTVEAAYSKRRRRDVLPLHPSLVTRLPDWLATKTNKVWKGDWANKKMGGRLIKRDMALANIERLNARGNVLDFHALRHTFVSSLARSGVHPNKAKELARHSTITLTMDVYSHVSTDELREALDTLPRIG